MLTSALPRHARQPISKRENEFIDTIRQEPWLELRLEAGVQNVGAATVSHPNLRNPIDDAIQSGANRRIVRSVEEMRSVGSGIADSRGPIEAVWDMWFS